MNYRKITAIFPDPSLKMVEQRLMEIGVPGMSVSKTHGFGEYRNFYSTDCMTDCIRVEVFSEADKADEIANAIMGAVHQGMSTDGIVAILPVEKLLHIREFEETKKETRADAL